MALSDRSSSAFYKSLHRYIFTFFSIISISFVSAVSDSIITEDDDPFVSNYKYHIMSNNIAKIDLSESNELHPVVGKCRSNLY